MKPILAGLVLAAGVTAAVLGLHAQDKSEKREPAGDPNAAVDYWQPLWMQRELWGAGNMPKGMQARVLRHWTFTQYGIPKEYQGVTSPAANTAEALASGGRLYMRHCSSCHGRNGLGDGVGAHSLLPSPALLAYMVQRPVAVDAYLLWSISDGGAAFSTNMPAFKTTLDRQEIWDIIAFMRAGFPERATSTPRDAK